MLKEIPLKSKFSEVSEFVTINYFFWIFYPRDENKILQLYVQKIQYGFVINRKILSRKSLIVGKRTFV